MVCDTRRAAAQTAASRSLAIGSLSTVYFARALASASSVGLLAFGSLLHSGKFCQETEQVSLEANEVDPLIVPS